MSRNFGLGSRVMSDAGRMALDRAAGRGDVSFSTAATQADRWASFSAWAKEQGVGRMERIDKEMVRAYGRNTDQVKAGDLAPATAQNYVSAVNSVMSLATKGAWESVSPTKDCGIAQRSAVREERTRRARSCSLCQSDRSCPRRGRRPGSSSGRAGTRAWLAQQGSLPPRC